MSNFVSWEKVIRVVDHNGNEPSGRESWEYETDLDIEDTALIEEDDCMLIVVGTVQGNALIREHSLTYPDGVTLTYESDEHRETCICDVLPKHLAQLL